MGSSLDEEYCVTCVATEVSLYSPCVVWSRGGVSERRDGTILEWVIGWVCGRGSVEIEF